MLVFRSILVPIKAALLNLLSIGAAYGVLVMVSVGLGAQPHGVRRNGSHCFVYSDVHVRSSSVSPWTMKSSCLAESKRNISRVATNAQSVIFGISNTARDHVCCAHHDFCFLGFCGKPGPNLKMMGLGLPSAIFVDATVVRVVLVPASMKLMGDANWWFLNG